MEPKERDIEKKELPYIRIRAEDFLPVSSLKCDTRP